MMNFRSLHDLGECIGKNLSKLPDDIDLIVGIPRSGLLAANLASLYLNLPLVDLEGFCRKRIFASGNRLDAAQKIDDFQHALVIDDSIASGGSMAAAIRQIEASGNNCKITYASVYSDRRTRNDVDIIFEQCKMPRMFEWNMMHHQNLAFGAIDIDGVLCHDPEEKENDDGSRYIKFLKDAKPLFIPTVPLHSIISSRLEKYRVETESWLRRMGIQFGQLYLLDLPSKKERLRQMAHGSFKADVLKSINAEFYIESDFQQATEIARKSGKPVISVEGRVLISPHGFAHSKAQFKLTPHKARRFTFRVRQKVARVLNK